MNEIDYNKIACAVIDLLPEKWNKVVIFVQYSDTSYSMGFYVDFGSGKYIDCYSLPDVSENDIYSVFSDIDAIVEPVYSSLNKKDKWSVMTMLFSCDGNFKVEYDYTDISENSIEYITNWEKKYLI